MRREAVREGDFICLVIHEGRLPSPASVRYPCADVDPVSIVLPGYRGAR